MTIEASNRPRRLIRPLMLVVAALMTISLAGVTARTALAATTNRHYLSAARSADVLRTAFGVVSEHPIRVPQVVVAPTSAATWALSDDVNMANQAWNPRTARTWAHGDAQAMWPAGMGGFTDPTTGTVYVNAQNAVESNVPHELLHANASPDFLQSIGVAINEGVTEQLALDAMAGSGLAVEKVPAYPQERALADAIVKLTGRDRLLQAYFNGGSHVADFIAAIGADTLAQVKNAAAGNGVAAALAVVESVVPSGR